MIKSKKKKPRRRRARLGSGRFTVHSHLAAATGGSGPHARRRVRVLPSSVKNRVVLEATNGRQAVCLVAPGEIDAPRLVPLQALPSRRTSEPVTVSLTRGRWRCSDGSVAADDGPDAVPFPPIGDVLPDVGHDGFALTESADRSGGKGPKTGSHVMLGIDVDLLRRVSDALGDRRLLLFVPIPVRSPDEATEAEQDRFVKDPVAVCPADDHGGVDGVAVVMPLTPKHDTAYYRKVRRAVVASERSLARNA